MWIDKGIKLVLIDVVARIKNQNWMHFTKVSVDKVSSAALSCVVRQTHQTRRAITDSTVPCILV